jgi:hypothetical protein
VKSPVEIPARGLSKLPAILPAVVPEASRPAFIGFRALLGPGSHTCAPTVAVEFFRATRSRVRFSGPGDPRTMNPTAPYDGSPRKALK